MVFHFLFRCMSISNYNVTYFVIAIIITGTAKLKIIITTIIVNKSTTQ